MTLPRIFGDNQTFVEPSEQILASLDAPTRARLDGVRTATNNLKSAQAGEKAAMDEIVDAEKEIETTTAYSKRHFPPEQFHDLWLAQKRERERRTGIS